MHVQDPTTCQRIRLIHLSDSSIDAISLRDIRSANRILGKLCYSSKKQRYWNFLELFRTVKACDARVNKNLIITIIIYKYFNAVTSQPGLNKTKTLMKIIFKNKKVDFQIVVCLQIKNNN